MKITIPAIPFKAVALAQSKEKTHYYLRGVFVEKQSLVATDGHILLKYDTENSIGDHEPFIMSVDTSDKAFKAKSRQNNHTLMMFADTETLIIEFFFVDLDNQKVGKRVGVCGFEIVDGTFPDYNRVIPDHKNSSGLAHFAFDARKIETFRKASELVSTDKGFALVLTFGESASEPCIIHMGDSTTPMSGVLMPLISAWR